MLLNEFQAFIQEHELISKGHKILLAVSGGIDSMVLLDLCRKSSISISVAHCNFQLREIASFEDEVFVESYCKEHGIEYYSKRFETATLAKSEKTGIQETARNLRYVWFETLRKAKGFDSVATAHNQNDRVETFLFNLSRGAGLNGLSSIPIKNQRIIRPLLFASKAEIKQYAKEHLVPFREDSSNADTKYRRNFIRHEVIPKLEELESQFIDKSSYSIHLLNNALGIYTDYIDQKSKDILVQQKDKSFLIEIVKLQECNYHESVLYEILKSFGFNAAQAKNIYTQLGQSGPLFFSQRFKLLLNREQILIEKIKEEEDFELLINKEDQQIICPYGILELEQRKEIQDLQSPEEEYVDMAELSFPLQLRNWQAGDQFQPLGMDGKSQSLQDFFTNQKVSRFDKSKSPILLSDQKICAVLGMRIDERFKISPNSKDILVLKWRPS